jgi:hypothetical protein
VCVFFFLELFLAKKRLIDDKKILISFISSSEINFSNFYFYILKSVLIKMFFVSSKNTHTHTLSDLGKLVSFFVGFIVLERKIAKRKN